MIRNNDYFEIIKEQNKEQLAKFRPFKSAYEMKKEIERLNNIINEVVDYTTKQMKKYEGYDRGFENVLSNIVVMLGSDKEWVKKTK